MFLTRFTPFLVVLVVVTMHIEPARAASGNWLAITNDTGKTIVVQDTVIVNGDVRRGKARYLLAGETSREYLPGPTVKHVEIFDGANPTRSLWSGKLKCPTTKQRFSVLNTNGKITVRSATTPRQK